MKAWTIPSSPRRACTRKRVCRRPVHIHEKVAEAQTVVDDMASLFLTDQASLSDVLKKGQELIAALSE